MRATRALGVLPAALTAAFALEAVTLVVRKTLPAHLSDRRAWQLLVGTALLVGLALLVAVLRRLPPRVGTVVLDRHHALKGRLTNALAFAALPATQRTPLMDVAIDDACENGGRLEPSKAMPLRVPSELGGALVVGLGVLALAFLRVPLPVVIAPQAKTIDAIAMTPDDLALFRDAAKQFDRPDQSPEVKAAVERFNQLIEDIANKRLDRTEAFRRMEAIERELLKGAEADAKSLDDALKDAATELRKSDLSRPIGESLEKKDLEKTKKDLKELAAALRSPQKKPDKASLDKLRQALAKAASRQKEALAAVNEKRAEIREQLLNKKKDTPDGGAPNPEDERLLKKKERELERLDRDAEQKERAARQLDRLDRELAKAAEDLMKDLGLSAQDLEQAAEDINRMQEQEMSEKQKEELRQRMEELRELLRQQGQGGKQRMARMMKFGKRAQGGGGGKQGDKDQGENGQAGDEGDEPGEQGKDGNGHKDGSGQGKGGQLVLGPGGQKILMPGGQGSNPSGGGLGAGQGAGEKGGQDGAGNPGKGIGTEHDAALTGKGTDLKGSTTDVQEQGLDAHQGPSNSEVILGAAERGFKGTGYKKVFTDYHTVAEQQINKDKVPDGYRSYVHRYFQLIRPRE